LYKNEIDECKKAVNKYDEQYNSPDFNVDNILMYDKKIKTKFKDTPDITYIGGVLALICPIFGYHSGYNGQEKIYWKKFKVKRYRFAKKNNQTDRKSCQHKIIVKVQMHKYQISVIFYCIKKPPKGGFKRKYIVLNYFHAFIPLVN
jgi:hypothetical protein